MSLIAANLERVRNQIADACAKAGRPASDVNLMAVSKTHPAEAALEAIAAGQRLFGENRVQEFASKRDALAATDAQFHLIGPLQSNKTTRAAEIFHAFDALDSLRIAERLDATCATLDKKLPILIEVKLSHEDTKHGLAPEELPALLDAVAALPQLELRGLMTVPPFSDDPEEARPYFAQLRALRDQNIERHPTLLELSMGMSHDFAVAVQEGSTTVRVGTAIFGKREYA
ncbi:MAG: YggS family pyridoxal phosphate-dependent enzyme [Acidobacteriaceae bacterium]|nr:YggS family pyridoxal phosphate-dependent enzyme [Acidobacteriaceae bacterium]